MTDSTGIEFSITVIAYPEPQYELERDKGTIDNQMMHSLTINAVNSFTIHFIQTVVNQSDFRLYRLKVGNLYGKIIVFVNVVPQSKYLKTNGLSVIFDHWNTHACTANVLFCVVFQILNCFSIELQCLIL